MIALKDGTRLIQTLKNKKNNQYTLMNMSVNFESTINSKAEKVIKQINNLQNFKQEKKLLSKYNDFITSLKDIGLLTDSNNLKNEYKTYLFEKKQKLPLSCLNIELTNGCNLRCIHCYGKFGCAKNEIQFIDKEKLINLIPSLNFLNCKSVAFTGGESTIHPNFVEIVENFIKNGFEITIFTNGFNSKKIIELINKYPNFPFIIKISLDGFEEIHDKIRGRKGSYKKVITLLDFLNEKKHIDTHISTTIMKCNIDSVNEFEKFMKTKYPKFNFNKDLIFPMGNGFSESFSVKEFEEVNKKCPSIFTIKEQSSKIYRCSGGISQCTIMPDGKLKICNGACDERFFFEHNAFEKGLVYCWKNCGKNIKFYRKEKNKKTKKCNHCKMKSKCFVTDCRILALGYTKDEHNPSPIACFCAKNNVIHKNV